MPIEVRGHHLTPAPPPHDRDLTSSSTAKPLIDATGVTRRYGRTYALRGVDLQLFARERVALLGPNGAGKTTLLRVLATSLRPAAGQIQIGGIAAQRDPGRARPLIGFVGHQTHLYTDMTVRENLRFYGKLYRVADPEVAIAAALQVVDLESRADALVRTLSRGLQQRAAVARAILHQPRILLLDEPETGLDDSSQQALGHLLASWITSDRAVLFTTHRLDWAQTVADRVIVIAGGRITAMFPTPTAEPNALAEAYRLAVAPAHTTRDPAHMPPSLDAPTRHDSAEPPRTETNPFHSPAAATAWNIASQIVAVLGKDLRIEWRTKDALSAMLVFAFLVLVTFNFALDLRPEVMSAVGPGILWVAVVFASTLGLGRTFAVERDQGTLEGLLLAPLDRSALFFAKLASNLVFMLALELVSLPIFTLLFNVTMAPVPVMATLALGAVGLAAVGTLFSAIAAHTRAREVMLPVLLFPVIVPLLIGVVQATGLVLGSETARDMPWLSLLAAFAAIYIAAGAVVFEYVLEE